MKTISILLIFFFSFSCLAQKTTDKKNHYNIPKGFVYIPPGTLKTKEKDIKVQAFYIYQTEVSNGDYQEFIAELEKKGETEKLKIASIKSVNWNAYEITDAENYSKWKNYPVVNISKESAELYCEWLTEKNRTQEKTTNTPEFRLPLKHEWIWAAKGNLEADYPFGEKLKDKKGNYKIQAKAFGNKIGPIEVMKKQPNNYGLYNTCGNVAEIVADKNIAMGGSWDENLKNTKTNSFQELKTSPTIGFRPVISYFTE